MFRSTSRAHKALMLAASVAAITGASATSAQAAKPAPTTHDFVCDMPLVGEVPFKVELTSTLPSTVRVGTPVPSSTTATLTSQDDGSGTDAGYTLFRLIAAKSVEGLAAEDANLALPGGANLAIRTPLSIPATQIPASAPLVLRASGQLPAISFPAAGQATLTVSKIDLNLTAYRADGTPIDLSQAQIYPDSDGNPDTFDTPCTPVEGPITVATIKVKR